MKFEIKGNETRLRFGIKFVRLMDEKYKVDYEGLEFGMGVMYAQMGLAQRSVPTLSDIICAATGNEYHIDDIDQEVEKHAENGELKKLFEQIEGALGKSPVVQETIKAIEKANKEAKESRTNP